MKLKTLILFLSLHVLMTSLLCAQTAEKIYSITRVSKPNEYYTQQANLWLKRIEKNKQDADAWLNYYRASRYQLITGGQDSAGSKRRFQKLENIVQDMGKNIPNTFEYNYVKWANGGNNMELFSYLEKAYTLNPNRIETYPDLTSCYELKGDETKRDFFAKKWYDSGDVSPGILNYNYNVLQSLKPNAILVTCGDNDTYPIWILQAAKGLRSDVKVLNVNLLFNESYCQAWNNLLGINLGNPGESNEKAVAYIQSIIQTLGHNKSKLPVYVGLTVSEEYTKPAEENLYLTGLVYEYSTEKFDNIAVLRKNLEQNYALDYLKMNFALDHSASTVALANTNYIVPFITLYEHYSLSGENDKAEYWKNLAKTIAHNSGMEESLKSYFNE